MWHHSTAQRSRFSYLRRNLSAGQARKSLTFMSQIGDMKSLGLRSDLKEADSEASRERFTLPELERREKLLILSASDPLCDSGWLVLPGLAVLLPLVGLLLPTGCPDLCPDRLLLPRGCLALCAVEGIGSCAPGGSGRSPPRLCKRIVGTASCRPSSYISFWGKSTLFQSSSASCLRSWLCTKLSNHDIKTKAREGNRVCPCHRYKATKGQQQRLGAGSH